MSNVKRYVPVDQWGQDLPKCMVEDEGGTYVRASDYDALAARLAESEAECLEQARLNGMGSEREARLIARLAEAERDAARIEWLASNPRGGQIVVDGKTQDCVFWGISGHPRATLRDAIDAARATDSATVGRNCQTLASLDSEDAARFRWLCDDHADKAVRHLRDSLLERMSVMSLSAVRAAIGIHLSNMPAASADAVPHCGNCGRDGCPYCDPRLTTTVDGVNNGR